ncbi:receptor-type tyrosine-protein phosphatase H isoform X5 [Phyllobates terribilis]|uniref:receptor-type tyrosine-protein phosphatase H isoform X5 n=1 Tax=Phyllobates terribilis TaxID=111132 RepID=UPI003CCB0743
MALHYIIPGRYKLPSLLLTFLLYLGEYRIEAQSAPLDVTDVKVATVTENNFTVSWTNSTSANITDYRVIVSNGASNIINMTINTSPFTAMGLSPGFSYTITIYTIDNTGTSSLGSTKNVTTLPSSVSDFQVTSVGTNQITLSWTVPTDINRGTYQYSINTQPGNTNSTSNSSSIVIPGLSPGTNYTFTIFTLTQDKVKSQKSQQTTTTTKPSAVKNLVVSSTSENSVILKWNSSSDPSSPTYTYTVVGGPTNQTGIMANTTEIKGLAPGTGYNFTVFAFTPNGVSSAASNVASATTLPSTVMNLQITSVSDTSVNLMWTPSPDPNKSSYTYTVKYGSQNKTGITTSTVGITDLAPGTDYSFTVYAVTSNGTYSNPSTAANTTTLPSMVMNLQITSVSDTSVNLMWTPSPDPNKSSYTYTVKYGSQNKTGITTSTVGITDLAPGTDYSFTVYAVTSDGTYSNPSTAANTTTLPSIVTSLQITSVSDTSVNLTWTPSPDPNKSSYTYTVKYGSQNKTGITTSTVGITDLAPGTDYSFTVYAVTSNGTYSNPSIAANTTTLPSMVMNLQITSVSDTSVNLTWTPSSDPNKSSYTYTVKYGSQNKTGITTSTVGITGLAPGTDYSFTVYAVTSNGTFSNPSTAANATTLPSMVMNLQITSVSDTSVNLTWTPSSDPNKSSYTYTVKYGSKNKTGITTSTVGITDLAPGTDYSFTVYAVTSNGTYSNPSTAANTTTLSTSVTNLVVTSVSDTSVTLMWPPSSDPNNSSYTYTVKYGSKSVPGIKNNTAVVTGLAPGTDYSFTVFSVTSNGTSSNPSNVANATTQPSQVTNLKVSSVTSSSATLTWTPSSDINSISYSYTVNYGSTNITGIKTSPTEIKSLDAGTEYSFTIYAVINGISSKPSNVVKGTTEPNVVQGVNVMSVSETTVTLQWNLSTDPNNNNYTYTVDGQGAQFTKISNINSSTNSVVIQNLLPGVDYNLTVSAVTWNNVSSDPSKTVSTTTKPSIVQGVEVVAVSETTVTLHWDLSKDTNTMNYTYTVGGNGDNFNTISNISINSVVVQNLLPGVDYSFTVSAVTKNKVSSQPSNLVRNTTMPSTVPTFNFSGKSNNSVSLTWTFPNDINKGTYKYIVVMNDSIQLQTSNDSLQVTNLAAGQTYSFTIYTVTINGVKSNKYPSISCTTPPNAPNNLQGNAVNISEIYITWTQPEDVNVNLYTYHVTWQDTTASQKETTSDSTKGSHFSIQNLLPGHLYNIIVTSVIQNTQSVNAQIFTATKSVTTQDLTVGTVSNTSVTLTWKNPNTPDSLVSGYRVTVYANGDRKTENETSEEKYVVNNLDPGNVYNITVESYSRILKPVTTNRASRADNSITSYSTPSFIKVETDPDPVGSLGCSKVDAYQIKVMFECPVGNYSSFEVLVNSASRSTIFKCPDNIVISNLQPAASYKISVKTVATYKTTISGVINCATDNTGVIVGSIFGVLLFLLLIAVIAFFVLKKRRSKGGHESFPGHGLQSRKYHTIPKNNFKQHYEKNHADSDFGFAEEYQALHSVGINQSRRAADLPDNKVKNRFTNVLPYDHSRVKLPVVNGESTSDYINANYMPGYNSTKEFIASQGPLPNTTTDFWRMVWEHQVNTIVMLTNCMENGRVKCEHYWPLDYTPCTYGDIAVTCTLETNLPEWTTRDFSIRRDNEPGIKYLRHFHFTAWPDHGVPESTTSIIQFRNLVREHMDQHRSNGPTVIHCSAGVGRTGTLIAIDYLIQQIEREQRVGVYGFVEKMRMNRNLMVQTEAQYVFLNKCILDLIDQPGDDSIYENQKGNELVYENLSAIRNHQNENI